MLLALGLFTFELASLPFDELRRSTEWKHARSGRVGARDATQYLGPGAETVSISGALIPGVAGSFAAIRTLRDMADEGDSWPLVSGTGEVLGSFVVLRLEERRRTFTIDGVPRWTDFDVELGRVA